MAFDLKYIDIDRTIYENLRQKAVEVGYLPDILSYPTTMQGKEDWLSARQLIEEDKGFIVDIFGVGASIDRGELVTCRMIVQRLDARNGSVTSSEYEPSNGGFRKVVTKYSRDITYEIRVISRIAEQEQLMNDIIEAAFPGTSKYLIVNSGRHLPNTGFTIKRNSDYNVGVYDHIERRYTYSVQDVFIDSSDNGSVTIVPITTIDFTVSE
jgi:hypothetical protein